MSLGSNALNQIRRVLTERSFTERQVEKLLPRIHNEQIKHPQLLAEIIDTWNSIMRVSALTNEHINSLNDRVIPPTASPPNASLTAKLKIDMNTILADIEPDLLLFEPKKLIQRHFSVQKLGVINNLNEHWTVLFNAPRGFYLQNWVDLTKKIYYIETKVIDLLYDKKESKEMITHPIIKSAAAVETDFDHIRTRYLFAHRTGYRELSHMQKVQTALNRPAIKDVVLSDDVTFLQQFSPYCSVEDYSCFANLIKNHELEDDESEVITELAELEALRYEQFDISKLPFDSRRIN